MFLVLIFFLENLLNVVLALFPDIFKRLLVIAAAAVVRAVFLWPEA
jgi:hypothetical protein